MIRALATFAIGLRNARRGNVLMMFAFAIIPMTFATGMGIDYSRAARLRTKLNALADAAALAAVSKSAMQIDGDAYVKLIAQMMFESQAKTIDGIDGSPVLTITVTHPDGPKSRAVSVTYTAKSINSFGGVLDMRSIPIGGTSTATAATAPNMDFYLALDTSPSMALPTKQDGIKQMDETVHCTFACHSNKIEVNGGVKSFILDDTKFKLIKGNYTSTGTGANEKLQISADGAYRYVNRPAPDGRCKSPDVANRDFCVYNQDGSYADSYWYALNQGIRLRVTDERSAVSDLMTLAKTYAQGNGRTYRSALYTFDHKENLNAIVAQPSELNKVSDAVGSISVALVNDKGGNGCPIKGCGDNRYLFTSFQSILDKMSTVLPSKSGNGTDAPGDTPQAFLFLVTDGMSDENIGQGRTRSAMRSEQITQCTAIKNRGIKIAILYTEYTAESIKDDEESQRKLVEAAIPNVAPQLTRCASPDLMYTVKTGESMSAALQSLFTKATASAHLSR